MIVEGDNPLGRARQVGDDESDAGIEFTRVPLDLGNDAARGLPALRPIAEVGVVPSNLNGRPTDGALEQMSDPLLQDVVGGSRIAYLKCSASRNS